ncbi:TetR family transcriptional regulator [Sorangium sp. So ce291]|uniref:TetR family transcriptional regulator n=1 Tax=Sorangium sp. So ce291 TaxID=3133294 RepID=UPI003F60B18A
MPTRGSVKANGESERRAIRDPADERDFRQAPAEGGAPRAAARDGGEDRARGGTEALTLGHLAERAGVSKPIAYQHFETRSGHLIALARQIDDRQVAALLDALKRTRQGAATRPRLRWRRRGRPDPG